MATLSNILAWKIPWTNEPGRLQSIGLQSMTRPSMSTYTHTDTHTSIYYEHSKLSRSTLFAFTQYIHCFLQRKIKLWLLTIYIGRPWFWTLNKLNFIHIFDFSISSVSSCFTIVLSSMLCCCSVAQLCLSLGDPTDCIPSGSSVLGISQAEHWSGLPCPSPGDLPDPGMEITSPVWWVNSLTLSYLGSPIHAIAHSW